MIASYSPELDQPSVKQDDVATRGDGVLEGVDRLLEAEEDVRLAKRLDTGHAALEVADPAKRLGPDDPVGRLVERHHAELVPGRHRRGRPKDRLLADVDLPDVRAAPAAAAHPAVEAVAMAGVHRARLVDDDHERDVGLLLPVADAHVDREGLLDRRVLVAAGAVAPRATDHHEALAEITDVDLEGRHLALGQ